MPVHDARGQLPDQATHARARRELLKPSASIALHRHSNALVDILPPEADSSISLLSQSERPDVTYQVPCRTRADCSCILRSAGPCMAWRA